jgi:pilus assembly protein CpaF
VSGAVGPQLLDRVRERLAHTAGEPTTQAVAEAVRAECGGVLGDTDLLRVLRELQTELTGAGPLEELLCLPRVSDVLVTAPDRVWIERGDGLELTRVRFADEAAVRRLATRLALSAGRRLDDAQPWVDGALSGVGDGAFGVRLHAVLPPVAHSGTCISLRVLRPASMGLEQLCARGVFTRETLGLLRRIVAARVAFLVIGGTGAGKTTLLSALLGAVDAAERIVCVEDSPELAPQHPHVVSLVARAANVEGVGEVSLRELVKQSLRMRPDRIVVGEVRGSEVVDLLTALNTGHDGGCGTIHANSPDEVPARLEALAALGGMDRAALHSQLAAALRVVLHVARRGNPDGTSTRELAQIAVLSRADGGWVVAQPAWTAADGAGPAMPELLRLLGRDR